MHFAILDTAEKKDDHGSFIVSKYLMSLNETLSMWRILAGYQWRANDKYTIKFTCNHIFSPRVRCLPLMDQFIITPFLCILTHLMI